MYTSIHKRVMLFQPVINCGSAPSLKFSDVITLAELVFMFAICLFECEAVCKRELRELRELRERFDFFVRKFMETLIYSCRLLVELFKLFPF